MFHLLVLAFSRFEWFCRYRDARRLRLQAERDRFLAIIEQCRRENHDFEVIGAPPGISHGPTHRWVIENRRVMSRALERVSLLDKQLRSA